MGWVKLTGRGQLSSVSLGGASLWEKHDLGLGAGGCAEGLSNTWEPNLSHPPAVAVSREPVLWSTQRLHPLGLRTADGGLSPRIDVTSKVIFGPCATTRLTEASATASLFHF